jgi:transposase InsO family protein
MEINTTTTRPFEKCSLDTVGPLTETQQGNRYVLTFQDELSGYLIAIPIAQQDSETVAREFVKNIVLRVGNPDKILTDQASNFLSDVLRNTSKMLKIKKLQTTPFHPETNGGLECSNRVLKEYLRHYTQSDKYTTATQQFGEFECHARTGCGMACRRSKGRAVPFVN